MYPLQALEHCNQPYKEDGLIREGVFEEEEEQEEQEQEEQEQEREEEEVEKIIHVIHQRV